MKLSRITSAYKTVAVILVNTVLLIGVFLLVLHFVFPLEQSIWDQNLGGRRVSEGLVPEHYYFTDRATTDAIRKTLDDYVVSGHWQAHPWTGLINREFSSEHLNVDAAGRRRTVVAGGQVGENPPLTVWMFGGSTTFGWGVSDEFTVPSQVQAHLEQELPQRQTRVVNFGTPWYNSSHELTLFLAELRRSDAPQVVVFLDGLNDLVHSRHYRSESPLFPQADLAWESHLERMLAGPPWLRPTPSLPLFRGLRRLGSAGPSTLGGIRNATEQEAPSGSASAQRENPVEVAVARYLLNRRTLGAVCNELGIEPLFVLQPVPMWLDEARLVTTDAGYEEFARNVLENNDDSVSTIDLRGVFREVDSEVALSVEENGAHYSDVASQVLGRAIADRVLEVVHEQLPADLASQTQN